jgi:hypothetical protein
MNVRAETIPETLYANFMKMIDMVLYIDTSEKDFWLQEQSILIMTP